ncbi:MAG: dienelactone hydrolase family protein, partial [Alphaproteobacteria bacterium]|nr:dienelactone hydrolase family protein [Alphaproteobacteria bacterium]
LNAHIEDVTRRAALAGYTGLGLDLLSPVGGTPADANEARGLIGGLDRAVLLRNVAAAMSYLRAQPGAADPIGIVGFCWGGGVVGDVAVAAPDLDAAIVFYGRAPRLADVPDIRARMLMHYASRDDRINATVFPAFIDALKAAGKDFTAHLYEDAQHAFHNDTAQSRYNAAAAMLAWSRSVAFFDETLKG